MSTRRVYIEIDDTTDFVIKAMTKKSFMTNKDYQKFFNGLLHNATKGMSRR